MGNRLDNEPNADEPRCPVCEFQSLCETMTAPEQSLCPTCRAALLDAVGETGDLDRARAAAELIRRNRR